MSPRRPARARRVPVTAGAPTTPAAADYTRAYGVEVPRAAEWSAEQWARACFDDAPAVLRISAVVGWRAVLRLRLGPSHSPDHVLGWAVRSRSAHVVVLDVDSPFLTAQKVVHAGDGRLTVTTAVRSTRRLGGVVWSVARPVHQVLEPVLLTLAARRASRATG